MASSRVGHDLNFSIFKGKRDPQTSQNIHFGDKGSFSIRYLLRTKRRIFVTNIGQELSEHNKFSTQ
jgi:hypothetical protein